MEITTQSATSTQELGQKFGSLLKGGEIIALQGDLGAGKTTFVQGLAEGLGVKTPIVSPTFILMRSYAVPFGHFYHVDLYRLEQNTDEEIVELGIPDMWGIPENVFVIEWAERLSKMPIKTVFVKIREIAPESRQISFESLPSEIKEEDLLL